MIHKCENSARPSSVYCGCTCDTNCSTARAEGTNTPCLCVWCMRVCVKRGEKTSKRRTEVFRVCLESRISQQRRDEAAHAVQAPVALLDCAVATTHAAAAQ